MKQFHQLHGAVKAHIVKCIARLMQKYDDGETFRANMFEGHLILFLNDCMVDFPKTGYEYYDCFWKGKNVNISAMQKWMDKTSRETEEGDDPEFPAGVPMYGTNLPTGYRI